MKLKPLISPHSLDSLKNGFSEVYNRWGKSQDEAEAIFDRLSRPSRVLEQLHALAEGVLNNDEVATGSFRSAVRDLISRFPSYGGSVDSLRSRIGYTPSPEPQGGIPCALIEPIGIAPIYFSLAATFGTRTPEFELGADVIAGLSLDHGHLEVANGALVHEGLKGLEASIRWTEAATRQEIGRGDIGRQPLDGRGLGTVGYTPDPDGPLPPPDWPRFPPDWPRFPGFPVSLPRPDICELLREGCELRLIGALGTPIGAPPPPLDKIAWADNIERIDLLGRCAGGKMIVHGVGFADPGPPDVELVMRVNGKCIPVQTYFWVDDRIELTLPEGVQAGPVGFVHIGYLKAYNAWVGRFNQNLAQMEGALQCLGIRRSDVRLPSLSIVCPPVTQVNVVDAGLPIIHSFTVNFDQVVVVDPDENLILRWNVSSADDLTLQRVTSVGPTFGGNTSVQNPSGSSWNLGAASHNRPREFRYRLTASNPCGSVSTEVRINASKRPGIAIDRIEVTQGIQTVTNYLPLVQDKPTVVRVYASHALEGFWNNAVPSVTGRLRTRQRGGAWNSWLDPINNSATTPPTPTPGASITVPSVVNRANTNDTLNFLLPTGRCHGEIDIEVQLRVTGFGAVAGLPGFDQSVSRVFESSPHFGFPMIISPNHFGFYRRNRLVIRYVRVRWNGTTPTDAQCQNTLRLSIQRIPSPPADIAALPGVGVQSRPTPNDFDDVIDLVDDFDDRHNCSFWEALTSWLGSDCPEDDGAYWALVTGGASGGKAADIPSNTYLTPRNDMNRAPHELGHSLNQLHIEVACPNGRQAGGGDDPDDWSNQGQLTNVPFDIENNTTVTATNNVWDIMTYCGTRWTMPGRWLRLYYHIGG